jgi:hypothetical protein
VLSELRCSVTKQLLVTSSPFGTSRLPACYRKRFRAEVPCRLILLIVLCLGGLTFDLQAQTQKPPSQQPDDVIRINTELVQTDVMVFDKKGHFVEGLQREQFEL